MNTSSLTPRGSPTDNGNHDPSSSTMKHEQEEEQRKEYTCEDAIEVSANSEFNLR